MYEIAPTVRGWLGRGLPVSLGRVVEVRGFSTREPAATAAAAPGADPVGSRLFSPLGLSPGFHDVVVDEDAAVSAGLACGGVARVLVEPASALPSGMWDLLAAREPMCLVTSGGETRVYTRSTVRETGPEIAGLFAAGVPETRMLGAAVVTVLWPPSTLVVIGEGVLAEALAGIAAVLGWTVRVGTAVPDGLTRGDALVVLSHDRDVDGPALKAGLAGEVGYVGALGSRRTQRARAEWLAAVGVIDLSRVHGPAGLDIGSTTAGEIAVAIVAEILAVRSGRDGASLRTVVATRDRAES